MGYEDTKYSACAQCETVLLCLGHGSMTATFTVYPHSISLVQSFFPALELSVARLIICNT